MKEIIYKRLRVEGFQSLAEPFVFELDRGASVSLLKGTNGVGKTTIFNAIWWAEYGDNMKSSVNTWEDRRTPNYQGTRVAIERSIGDKDYLIARHSSYKGTTIGITGGDSLLVFVKDKSEPKFTKEHLIDAKYKKDAQDAIKRQLGINSKVFMNSIIFGQKMEKLIQADNKDKRDLFEELFSLTFVDDAMESARDKQLEALTKTATKESELSNKRSKIIEIDEDIEELKAGEIEWDMENTQSIETLKSYVRGIEEGDHKSAKNKRDEIIGKVEELKTVLESMKNDKENYQEAKSDYSENEGLESEAKKKLNEAQEDYEKELSNQKKSVVDMAKEAEQLVHDSKAEAKKKLNLSKENVADLKKKIARIEETIDSRKEAIKSVMTVCPTCEEKIKPAKVSATKKVLSDENAEDKKVISVLNAELHKAEKSEKTAQEDFDSYDKKLVEAEEAVTLAESSLLADYKDKISNGSAIKVLEASQKLYDKYVELGSKKLETFEKCKEAYNLYDTKATELSNLETELATAHGKVETAETLIASKKEELKRLQDKDKPSFSTEHLEASKDEINTEATQLEEELATLIKSTERLNWWIKKGFGAGGLKAYVFESMLKKLNNYCLNYHQQLGFRVEFSVDLTKASKPFKTLVYYNEDTRDYFDLSGGQQQRVDICIAFAMHDLITENAKFNILALDEIFEGLDTEGIETAFELIRIKGQQHSVYVVTHNDIIDSMNCKTIEIARGDSTYLKV